MKVPEGVKKLAKSSLNTLKDAATGQGTKRRKRLLQVTDQHSEAAKRLLQSCVSCDNGNGSADSQEEVVLEDDKQTDTGRRGENFAPG